MASRLPSELCSAILEKIDDPHELAQLRTVCKGWEARINRLLPRANWKRLCFERIPEFSFLSIIIVVAPELQNTKYHEVPDQGIWQKVYFHHKKWMKMISSTPRTLTIKSSVQGIKIRKIKILLPKRKQITSVTVWFNWIAYITYEKDDEYNKTYVCSDFNNQYPHRIINTNIRNPILYIKFWRSDTNVLFLVGQLKSNIIRFWNIEQEDEPLPQFDFEAKILFRGISRLLAVSGNKVMTFTTTEENSVIIKWTIELDIGELNITALESHGSQIFILATSGSFLQLFAIEEQLILDSKRRRFSSSFRMIPSLDIDPFTNDTYISPNGTIIWTGGIIMSNSEEIISWRTFHDQVYLHNHVTSLIVHGNYVITGLFNGYVCINHIYSTDDSRDINLIDKKPVKIFKLRNQVILEIKIIQSNENINMIVVTHDDIFVISI